MSEFFIFFRTSIGIPGFVSPSFAGSVLLSDCPNVPLDDGRIDRAGLIISSSFSSKPWLATPFAESWISRLELKYIRLH